MATIKKIEELRQALAGEACSSPVVFILEKDSKHYLSDGHKILQELTPEDEARIRKTKIYIDDEDLNA